MKSRRRRAPGKALPRLRFSTSKRIDPKQVKALFRAGGWKEDLARYSPAQIQKLMRNSHLVLSVWNQKQLVGFASAVSDGVLCGLVENLIIHPDYRGGGLGTRMLRELAGIMKRQRITCLYVLGNRGKRAQTFFHRVGFRPLDWRIYLRLTR
jgi:N-acetylglutamate synthase-like GNAT family acetyltransferase